MAEKVEDFDLKDEVNEDNVESQEKRRKRGKRGGRRRGHRLQKGYNWNFQHGGFRSEGQMDQNLKYGQRGGRGFRESDVRNIAELTDFPDGILLVEDGDYVGYHCTYCNCVLDSLLTVRDHVAGFRHQLILEARNRLEEQRQKEGYFAQSVSENMENIEENEAKDNTVLESTPMEQPSHLKSLLEDDLSTIQDPVVGLDYITERQKPDQETSFECSLCKVVCDGDDMKVHIVGTRHRLMYLKITEPKKIAELMTKNLEKAERNKEIKEYIALLMKKHGRGTIVVEPFETSGIKVFQEKDYHSFSDEANKGTCLTGTVQCKRLYGEANYPRKKQLWNNSYSRVEISRGELTGRDLHPHGNSSANGVQCGEDHGYDRQLYQKENDETRFSHPHRTSPSQDREYWSEKDSTELRDSSNTN